MVVNSGTYCVILKQQISVSNCPLPKGACIWKHAVTGQCKYDSELASDITVADLCSRVGLPPPTEAQILTTKAALLNSIKAELN